MWALGLLGFAPMAACGPAEPDDPLMPPLQGELRLEGVANGFESPVYLTAPAGDDRLFIVEQVGRIQIVQDGSTLPVPFLDIRARVRSGGERGLLGMAFPPDFASSGFFFLHYSDSNGDTRVSRFRTTADANRADPDSERTYLEVPQPFSNHNGGQIEFGPDGMLYVALGDGGSGGDPLNAGQDRTSLLGSILRLDVSADPPYVIPGDNPFLGEPGARDEIWAWGLRNPWRFSFDTPGNTIYVGDVGQNRFEEINARPLSESGVNYGWRVREADSCFEASNCDTAGLVDPVLSYPHTDGCSVAGGYVYRGSSIPALQGHYVYGDFCSGWLRSFELRNGRAENRRTLDVGTVGSLSSFGLDGNGELYVLSLGGEVLRLTVAP